MPIEKQTLAAIATRYVAPMTNIRGRRVHRLLMREFSRFDHVLPAVAEDGAPALLAVSGDGSVAVCCTDGRGATVAVTGWTRLQGATLTISCDLLKDSLPIVSWTIWHPGFARAAGALTIPATDFPPADHTRITDILRRVGG